MILSRKVSSRRYKCTVAAIDTIMQSTAKLAAASNFLARLLDYAVSTMQKSQTLPPVAHGADRR